MLKTIKKYNKIQGVVWFIKHYGIKKWMLWEIKRRKGTEIDYSKYFTPSQLKLLEDNGLDIWNRK